VKRLELEVRTEAGDMVKMNCEWQSKS